MDWRQGLPPNGPDCSEYPLKVLNSPFLVWIRKQPFDGREYPLRWDRDHAPVPMTIRIPISVVAWPAGQAFSAPNPDNAIAAWKELGGRRWTEEPNEAALGQSGKMQRSCVMRYDAIA